jgi:hypothetical protein
MLKGWKRPRLASRHFAIAREAAQRACKKQKGALRRTLLLRFHTPKKKQMRDQSGNVDTPDYFEEDQADVGGAGVCLGKYLGKYYAHVRFFH